MLKADLIKRCSELEEELHTANNSIEYWKDEFHQLYERDLEREMRFDSLLGEFEDEVSKISLTKSIELKEILTKFFK